MMDEGFVYAVGKSFARPLTLPVEGRDRLLIPDHWKEIERKVDNVGALVINTLTGLIEYVKCNVDVLTHADCMIHVKRHDRVELIGKLEDEDKLYRRHTYLAATTDLVGATPFNFGVFLDSETFTIGLQAAFVPNAGRDSLIQLCAAISESSVRETVDTGVAQQVKVSSGITMIGERPVPNPVILKPWRTFREVEQPASIFVVRAQSNTQGVKPKLALFEADGGTWKLEAIKNIAAYLKAALPEPAIIA